MATQLRELNNKIADQYGVLSGLPAEEKEAIHRLALVSQVGASTRIENALLTDAEVNWIDTVLTKDAGIGSFQKNEAMIADKLSKDKERSIEEVAGCRSMLLLIYEQAREFLPLTESTVRGLHTELLQYYPRARHYLGRYKTVTNSVVERNARTGEERVVFKTADPGPITDVAMREIVGWYNENLREHPWPLAVACELGYRFLAIHPFQDGNGRLGRGLFLLALLQSPDQALATVARHIAIDRQIERHRPEYYAVLQRCSGGRFHQDPGEYKMEHFLRFMIKMTQLALDDVTVYRKRHAQVRALPDSGVKVLDCLKDYPEKKLQTHDLMKLTGLPRRTAIHSLNNLVKDALVQRYGRGASIRYQIVF